MVSNLTLWIFCKSGNSQTNEEKEHREEERKCACQSSKTLSTADGADQRVHCIDDITGQQLRWPAVRLVEQALKYPRDLRAYGTVDELVAVATYQVTPVDTK